MNAHENKSAGESDSFKYNMKQKRIIVGLIVGSVLLAFLLASARVVFRPAMPEEWTALQRGMSRERVLGTAVGDHVDMRSLKGFDVFTQESTMLGASCYWQVKVTYDDAGLLTNAHANFVYSPFGFFSRSPRSVLR